MHHNKHYRLVSFPYASLVGIHTCIIVCDEKKCIFDFETHLVDGHLIINL
jgi:hypothetical protein